MLSTTPAFPLNLDVLPQVQPGDTLAEANEEHDLLHNLIANTIAQIEQKLGINGSVSSSSLDFIAQHHQHQGSDNSAQFSRLPIRMTVSQSLNPLEVQDSGAVVRSAITAAGEFLDIGPTAGSLAVRSYVTGDIRDRWQVQADGTIRWGPGGSTSPDTALYRTGPGAMRADSTLGVGITPTTFALDVSGTARVSGAVTLTTPLGVASGGTGSATQNFVDLTTGQTVAGAKTFTGAMVVKASAINTFPTVVQNQLGSQIFGIFNDASGGGVLELRNSVNVAKWTITAGGDATGTSFVGQYISLGSGLPVGSSPIYANAPAGLTAQLINLQKNSVTQFQVDQNGAVTAVGAVNALSAYVNGVAGSNGDDITIQRAGGATAANARFTLSERSDNKTLLFYGYDGTTFKNFWTADYTTGTVKMDFYPGTTHEGNRIAATAQVQGGRGFTVAADAATFQGGVTTGISVAINRVDPALSLNNANGQILVGYFGATKTSEIWGGGNASFGGTNHYLGPNTFGGAGTVAHFQYGAGAIYLGAEGSPANVDFSLYTKGTGSVYLQNPKDTTFAMFQPDGTAHFYNAGTERVRVESAAGRLLTFGDQSGIAGNSADGTTRYLFGLRSDVAGNFVDLVSYTYGGAFRWFVGGPEKMKLDANGQLYVVGSSHYIGNNALGGTGPRIHLQADNFDAANTYFLAEGTPANISIGLRTKGTATIMFQNSTPTVVGQVDNNGATQWLGSTHQFGRGAFSANAVRIQLQEDGVNAIATANNPGATATRVDFIFRPSSHANAIVQFQNNGGGNWGYFSGTTVALTASLTLDFNSLGSRQLKAAGINTGPGGVGRVVYIDN